MNIFFFHHDTSWKAPSDNFIVACKLPLLYLRELFLNFNMGLLYSGSNCFPGNKDVRLPIKLANSKLLSILVLLEWCNISRNVFVFSDPIDRLPFCLSHWRNRDIPLFCLVGTCFYLDVLQSLFLKQIYCFYYIKETLFKVLVYSNNDIDVYCNCISSHS